MRLAAALALLALAGCLGVGAEGDETLVVRNAGEAPVVLRVQIVQEDLGLRIFDEQVGLDPGAFIEHPLRLRAGLYHAQVDTTHGIHDRLAFEVPSRGDTRIDLVVDGVGVTLRVGGG